MNRKHFELYRTRMRQWRWRLRAANGRILADSGESYWQKQDCLDAIELVKHSKSAPVQEL